jgi:hypothetical protein
MLTRNGDIIGPLRQTGGQYLFTLPPGCGQLHLRSRTFRPSETIGPFLDDRRALGVLVGAITLHQGRRKIAVTDHLARVDVPGWFSLDTTAHRWTNGRATLPVTPVRAPAILEIQILSAGPYRIGWEMTETKAGAARATL